LVRGEKSPHLASISIVKKPLPTIGGGGGLSRSDWQSGARIGTSSERKGLDRSSSNSRTNFLWEKLSNKGVSFWGGEETTYMRKISEDPCLEEKSSFHEKRRNPRPLSSAKVERGGGGLHSKKKKRCSGTGWGNHNTEKSLQKKKRGEGKRESIVWRLSWALAHAGRQKKKARALGEKPCSRGGRFSTIPGLQCIHGRKR